MSDSVNKSGFWRNFTWKRFILNTLLWFVITTLINEIFYYEHWKDFFISHNLLRTLIRSLVYGLIFTIWGQLRNKKDQRPTFDV